MFRRARPVCYVDGISAPTHLIAVLIADRRGIVAAITGTLAAFNIELVELAQTVVCGYFTITVAVAAPLNLDVNKIVAEAIRERLGGDDAVTVLPYRHTVEVAARCDRYILTASGEANAGVVSSATGLIARFGGNFVDFSFESTGGEANLMAEIDIPSDVALGQLQTELQAVGTSAGLRIRLQHQRLFTATNEIAFRRIGA